MPKYDYPYIRAWEAMIRSKIYYMEDQLALARKEKAPQDAMWRGLSGRWHCFSAMSPTNPNRALLMSYIKGIEENETI